MKVLQACYCHWWLIYLLSSSELWGHRSSKHEEAAKEQCAAGKKKEKERALQDLISVKFPLSFFCHNVKGSGFYCAFLLWQNISIFFSGLHISMWSAATQQRTQATHYHAKNNLKKYIIQNHSFSFNWYKEHQFVMMQVQAIFIVSSIYNVYIIIWKLAPCYHFGNHLTILLILYWL